MAKMAKIDIARLATEYAFDRRAVKNCATRHGVSVQTVYHRMDVVGLKRRKGGDINKGLLAREKNPNWNGGTCVRKDGYVLEYVNGKQFYQHRLVAKEIIGRELTKGEVVHHKNGDKGDNRPGNLEIIPSQSEHSKMHITSERARMMQDASVKSKLANKARE